MKNVLSITVLLTILAGAGLYLSINAKVHQGLEDSIINPVFTAKTQNFCSNKIAQRGCCSSHNGVCGCRGGRTVCCDGSLSPSCECRNDY